VTFAIRRRAAVRPTGPGRALYQRILAAVNAVPSVGCRRAGGFLPTKVETDEHRGAGRRLKRATIRSRPTLSPATHSNRRRAWFHRRDMRSPVGFVITQNLAKQLWPTGSPLGQRITVTIVAARADFGQLITLPSSGRRDHRIRAERPHRRRSSCHLRSVWPWMTFIIRSPRAAAIQTSIDDACAVSAVNRIHGPVERRADGHRLLVRRPRIFLTTLLSGFAATAMRSRRSDYMVSLPTA
jgi:hypothetical protein